MTNTILAIDLGKFNSVLCHFDTETREATFRTVKTTPAILRAELLRQPVVSVVIEACSPAGCEWSCRRVRSRMPTLPEARQLRQLQRVVAVGLALHVLPLPRRPGGIRHEARQLQLPAQIVHPYLKKFGFPKRQSDVAYDLADRLPAVAERLKRCARRTRRGGSGNWPGSPRSS